MARIFFLILCMLISGTSLARADILTSISAQVVDDPKSFWRAIMEEFYGRYDNRRKCWVSGTTSPALCMRPHMLSTVMEEGVPTYYVVIAGYALTEEGGHADCHACTGKLGLVILRASSDRLALVARNNLAEDIGSFGEVPAEDFFRLVEFGKGNHGWLMEFYYTGQGYTEGGVSIFGAIGDKIVDLGFISTHSDNGGTCGDGLGACYIYSYEILNDPDASDARFGDLLARMRESTKPSAPGVVRIPFSKSELKYITPPELEAALQ